MASVSSRDLSNVPEISFSAVESYAKSRNKASGDKHLSKGVRYYSEHYLQDIRVIPSDASDGSCAVVAKCYKSYRRNEKPYNVRVDLAHSPFEVENASCECPVGKSEGCGHIIGLLYQLAHYKMLGYKVVPEDIAKTSLPQTWHVPRGEKIGGKDVHQVEVLGFKKSPTDNADEDPPKPIKSTLYNPIRCEIPSPTLLFEPLQQSHPNSMMLDFLTDEVQHIQLLPTKYGNFRKGSVLSYQQKLSTDYIINNYADTDFPLLPAVNNMIHNLALCLAETQAALLQALHLSQEESTNFEIQTRVQSASPLWHKLRKGRITASNVGPIVKRRKEDVSKFLANLRSTKEIQTKAMKLGLAREPEAATKYSVACNDTVNVYPCGVVIHPMAPWLAASPDRKVYNPNRPTAYGLLEIKCPEADTIDAVDCLKKDDGGFLYLNRGHNYYYQIMTQLAVTGLPWCDLFVWCQKDDSSHLETIFFDTAEWQQMKDKIDILFFQHYLSCDETTT